MSHSGRVPSRLTSIGPDTLFDGVGSGGRGVVYMAHASRQRLPLR